MTKVTGLRRKILMNGILILVGIVMIAVTGIMYVFNVTRAHRNESKPKMKIVPIVIGIVLIVVSSSFSIIPTGFSGVKTMFGQISPDTATNGLNWKIPFVESIEKVNVKQQDITFKDKVWSETNMRTAIYYEGITVTYQIEADKAAWIFANVTDYRSSLVSADIVASAVKTSSKAHTDTDATNRGIIEPLIQENLQKSLDEKYGGRVVYVNKVIVSNVDFDASYNAAIEAKQVAKLNAEAQEIENQRAIDKAAADAEVAKTRAQAEADIVAIEAKAKADAILIEAEAQKEANRLLDESLTNNVLMHEYVERWNGQESYVNGTGFGYFDVSKFIQNSGVEPTENVTP